MIKINKLILIICFVVLLLMYIICKNDILNIFNSIFTKSNKLHGGVIEDSQTNDNSNTVNSNTVNSNTVNSNSVNNNSVNNNTVNNNSETVVNTTEVGNLVNEIEKEKNTITKMKNELESLQNSRASLNQLINDDDSKENYVKINRSIIEDINDDAITNIVNNSQYVEEETMEEEVDEETEMQKEKITKPWENLCEKDYNDKKKKSKYMDLKLELNTHMSLEPFNNDDFSEFGKFNC